MYFADFRASVSDDCFGLLDQVVIEKTPSIFAKFR